MAASVRCFETRRCATLLSMTPVCKARDVAHLADFAASIVPIRGRSDNFVDNFVGWVERSETHRTQSTPVMGFASLNPSYVLRAVLDNDVLGWFKSQGKGYQTRINTVLRRYYEAHRKAG
jgi:uncharacterized protein (DUF4415 family)